MAAPEIPERKDIALERLVQLNLQHNAKDIEDYLNYKYGDSLHPQMVKFVSTFASLAEALSIESPATLTFREEANVIAAYCFRIGVLEEYHSASLPIDDERMKVLMIESTRKLGVWLGAKCYLEMDGDRELYRKAVRAYEFQYTKNWEK